MTTHNAANKRAVRPVTKRTKPYRSFAKVLRAPPSADTPKATTTRAARPLIERTVQMGYELIDEYLRAGRDAADQAPAYASPASGSAEHLSERVLEYTSELAQLGLELVQALARSPTQSPPSGVAPPFARPRAGAAAHGGRETSGPPAEFQQTAFQLKVESTQRVNVSVELSRVSANASLLAQTPRRYQPQARRTPERGIELSIKLGAGTCAIRVRIAKSVAPGTYRSLIVERATNLPRGSIAIDVAGKPST